MGVSGCTATGRRQQVPRRLHRGGPGARVARRDLLQRDTVGGGSRLFGVRRASGVRGRPAVRRRWPGRIPASCGTRTGTPRGDRATRPVSAWPDARDRIRLRRDAGRRARARHDPVLRPEPRRRHVPVLCRGPWSPVGAGSVDDDGDDRVHQGPADDRGTGGGADRATAISVESAPAEIHLGSVALCDIRAVVEGHRATDPLWDGAIPLFHFLYHEIVPIQGGFGWAPEPHHVALRNAWNVVIGEIPGGVLTPGGWLLDRDTANWAPWDAPVADPAAGLAVLRAGLALRRGVRPRPSRVRTDGGHGPGDRDRPPSVGARKGATTPFPASSIERGAHQTARSASCSRIGRARPSPSSWTTGGSPMAAAGSSPVAPTIVPRLGYSRGRAGGKVRSSSHHMPAAPSSRRLLAARAVIRCERRARTFGKRLQGGASVARVR